MKSKAILAVALLLAMALAAFAIPAEDTDAANKIEIELKDGNTYNVSKGSTVTLTLVYTNTDRNYSSDVSVYVSGSSTPVTTETIRFIVSDQPVEEKISFTADKSGPMYISFTKDVHDKIYFKVNFETSIWDNWGIYAAIIIVVLLIVIFVVYKTRTAPKQKNQLTFEQIEAERQAKAAAPKAKTEAPKSERQRYLQSKKK